jgi:hypothetical protein
VLGVRAQVRGGCTSTRGDLMVSQRRAMSRQRSHKTCRRRREKFGTTTRKTLLHATVGSYGYASIVGCSKHANTKILEGQRRAKTRLKTARHGLSVASCFLHIHTLHQASSSRVAHSSLVHLLDPALGSSHHPRSRVHFRATDIIATYDDNTILPHVLCVLGPVSAFCHAHLHTGLRALLVLCRAAARRCMQHSNVRLHKGWEISPSNSYAKR